MSRKGNILHITLIAVAFIILEVAALSILNHNDALQNTLLMRATHSFKANVWGRTESLKHYFSLKRTNEELVRRNYELGIMLKKLTPDGIPAAADNTEEGSDTVGSFRYTSAGIVKISRNSQHNYLIINRGEEHGIKPMSGIVTEKGAIGIINAVSRNYSYGISFNNVEMAVSARLGRQGNAGTLVWDGLHSDGAILKEIPHHISVNEGDTLYTSGFSAIFPADIPLGVTGGKKVVNGSFYEIKVKLFEDFARLKNVVVVENLDKAEIEELEAR